MTSIINGKSRVGFSPQISRTPLSDSSDTNIVSIPGTSRPVTLASMERSSTLESKLQQLDSRLDEISINPHTKVEIHTVALPDKPSISDTDSEEKKSNKHGMDTATERPQKARRNAFTVLMGFHKKRANQLQATHKTLKTEFGFLKGLKIALCHVGVAILSVGKLVSSLFGPHKNELSRSETWLSDIRNTSKGDALSERILNTLIPKKGNANEKLEGFLDHFRQEWTKPGQSDTTRKALARIATRMRMGHAGFNTQFTQQLETARAGGDHMKLHKTGAFSKPGAEKNIGKIRGAQGFDFDPSKYNLPHEVASVKIAGKSVTVLRMGTPTIEASGLKQDNCRLTPEYEAFLFDCKETDKKHLDVIKQRRVGSEGPRTAARIDAAKGDYEGTAFAICIPDDGDLYEQEGLFEGEGATGILPSDRFIDQATDRMLTSPEYFLPDWLFGRSNASESEKALTARHELNVMMTTVKTQLFGDKATLTKNDRKLLMDVLYANIEKLALEKSGADSVNFTCKDGIDRGAVATRIFLTMSGFPVEDLSNLYVSGSLQAKGQVPIGHRHKRYEGFEKASRMGSDAVNVGDGAPHALRRASAPVDQILFTGVTAEKLMFGV